MINFSFEVLAQDTKNSIASEKLVLSMKQAIYTLRYKRLASWDDEETRSACIDRLQQLFGEIRLKMGVKELHLTVNEWNAQLKELKSKRARQNTILFTMLIYEVGLCYLSEAEQMGTDSPDGAEQALDYMKYAKIRFNEVRKLTDRFSPIKKFMQAQYQDATENIELPLTSRNDTESVELRVLRRGNEINVS